MDHRYHRFAALKILVAEASERSKELQMLKHMSGAAIGLNHVTEPIDHFQQEGPNGIHLCLLFEPMGPSANTMVEELPCFKPRHVSMKIQYPMWMAKRLLRQALQGLAFLHDNNIAHGDLQSGNMLFKLDLSNISEKEELKQDDNYQYGAISPLIERLDGKMDKWAPRYLAVPQPLAGYVNLDHDFKVKLSDLGAGECSFLL
jgi:serine/threonine protein kinase